MENNNENNNGNENLKKSEDDNLYSNPYAETDSKEKNEDSNSKKENNIKVEENNENKNNENGGIQNNEIVKDDNDKNNIVDDKKIENQENDNKDNFNDEKKIKEENIIDNNKNNEKSEKSDNNNNINDNNINSENKINNNIKNENKNINENKNQNLNDKKNNINSNTKKETIQKTPEKRKKLYTIKETGSHIYIENTKKISLIGIEKSFNKIYSIKDFNEILKLTPNKTYHVDSILGIIDINGNNKYLLVVSSSQLITNIMGADIFNILDVDLIQITLFNESDNEKNRKKGVKKLFQLKNFYYSNEIDLSNNLFCKNRKEIINDYCVNTSLLKYFFDNLISKDFYCKIIYGYIGYKKNIEISNNNSNLIYMDNLIIDRVNKHLTFNTDIPNQMKQIEFICIYKSNNFNKNNNNSNNNKKYNTYIFSFLFYISNEIANTKVPFNPWNNFIMNELSHYQNIVCIINNNININLNSNININNNKIGNIIFQSNSLGKKVKLLNFTSEWKKNLFFDSNNNPNMYIKSGYNNSNIIQEYIFWFIDINNNFYENDCCFNSMIRIMWKTIQQQIDFMHLEINIGQFNKNNTGVVCDKFKGIIMNYHNDLEINKKSLYKSQLRKQLQKVFDYYFNMNNCNNNINVYDNNNLNNKNNLNNNSNNKNPNNHLNDNNNFNKNNLNAYQSININNNNQRPIRQNDNNYIPNNRNNSNSNMQNNINQNKNNNISQENLSILCITWNIGGVPSDYQYNIRDLFTQNDFYKNNKSPDIIVIGMEEIVELDIINVLTINTNEESVKDWTNNITNMLNKVFPNTYKKSAVLNLIGIFCICFTKNHLKQKIKIVDTNVIKTGLFGTLGNKGYVNFTIKYSNILISFAVAHFEAGESSNEERIDTLKSILGTKNNFNHQKFKNSDFWFIIGDLNFRIQTSSFEKAYKMISNKEFKNLIRYDQFYACCKQDRELAMINEGKINFAPTYKFSPGSNKYINDPENSRIPSWTDRILFSNRKGIKNLSYNSIPSLMLSDHRPVQACFEIEINMNKDLNLNNNFNNGNNNFIHNFNSNENNNFNNRNNNFNNFSDNNFSSSNIDQNNFRNNNNQNFNNNMNYNNNINNNYNNSQRNNYNNNSNNNNQMNNKGFNNNERNNYNNNKNNTNYQNNNNNFHHSNTGQNNKNNINKSTFVIQGNNNNQNKNNNMSKSNIYFNQNNINKDKRNNENNSNKKYEPNFNNNIDNNSNQKNKNENQGNVNVIGYSDNNINEQNNSDDSEDDNDSIDNIDKIMRFFK